MGAAAANSPGADQTPFDENADALVLDPIFDLAAASSFKDKVLSAGGEKVILDAGQVDKISTAAVQIMLVVDRHLTEKSGILRVQKASAAWSQALTDLGLHDVKERWECDHGKDDPSC